MQIVDGSRDTIGVSGAKPMTEGCQVDGHHVVSAFFFKVPSDFQIAGCVIVR